MHTTNLAYTKGNLINVVDIEETVTDLKLDPKWDFLDSTFDVHWHKACDNHYIVIVIITNTLY